MNIVFCREGESWGSLIANPRMIQTPDGSLQINNASLNDSGQYTCTVKNDKITITAELDVLSELCIQEYAKFHTYLIHNWYFIHNIAFNRSQLTKRILHSLSDKTVIVKPPLALRIQRGKPATLTCEYREDSRQDTPQVQWRKKNQKLSESVDSDKYAYRTFLTYCLEWISWAHERLYKWLTINVLGTWWMGPPS